MERFGLTEKQAQAILDMRLQRLTGLEREQARGGIRRAAKADRLLSSACWPTSSMLLGIIKDEILEIKRQVRRRAPHGDLRPGGRNRHARI